VSLNAKDVQEILRALEESSFDELDLELNGVKLNLRRGSGATRRVGMSEALRSASAPAPERAASAVEPVRATSVAPPPGTVAVPAPLLGIFYRAPKPGEPAFVEVGAQVEADTTVGIIEVMKLMNTVRAGVAGEVVAIAAKNAALVEFGESLLFVRPR
jgi:acetyl-CoA carboxylase biotin carboxyl carrier protein